MCEKLNHVIDIKAFIEKRTNMKKALISDLFKKVDPKYSSNPDKRGN